MSRGRTRLAAAVFAALAALTLILVFGLIGGASSKPGPPGIVLRSGGQEQYGSLNNNEWCPLVVPVRCKGFVREAPEYPSEPLRVEPGDEMVFEVETWSIPTRFSAPDYGRNPTGGSEDFAPTKRAEVAAPVEPGEYEISASTDFPQGYVYRGFYVVVKDAPG